MKVTLINYTQHALETLIFTKSTRLRMTGRALQDIIDWPMERKMEEWKYMQGTIKSSWEFADYVFMIEGVTRAFTHQLVRHRVGTSFAQQAQRVVNMESFEFLTSGSIGDNQEMKDIYELGMQDIQGTYDHLVQLGAKAQDARGILPTNILTNICFKANLRTLHGMCGERLCVKAQGEFQDVMRAIRREVVSVHEWAEPALRVHCAQTGTCAFEGVKLHECPIKPGVFNPETGLRWDEKTFTFESCCGCTEEMPVQPMTKHGIQAMWEQTHVEIQPVVAADTDDSKPHTLSNFMGIGGDASNN